MCKKRRKMVFGVEIRKNQKVVECKACGKKYIVGKDVREKFGYFPCCFIGIPDFEYKEIKLEG